MLRSKAQAVLMVWPIRRVSQDISTQAPSDRQGTDGHGIG
jgi:hypothetical protein